MRYKTKEGRPLCRYCVKLLAPYYHDCDWGGGYGRLGNNLFCTATCAECWATRRITGGSAPRGKSHDWPEPAPLPPLYDTPHDRAVAELTGEEVVPLPVKDGGDSD